MTDEEYLLGVLKSQDLGDDSEEMKALRARRDEVEAALRAGFPECAPTIRYGGSKAKGTLVKDAYDLDLVCYFPHDDTSAGDTLEDIYSNAAGVLEDAYIVYRKRSALRIMGLGEVDFHIDVVPGRFTDDEKSDCFLHQEAGDKCRLKTNLDVHIAHVRDSGRLDAIRLLKVWKARRRLTVKQFAFELLAIKTLKGSRRDLPGQLVEVLTAIRDAESALTVEDPANRQGNDLSSLLAEAWPSLRAEARTALEAISSGGWQAVFGIAPQPSKAERLRAAAAAVSVPTRPWCG